MYVRVLSARYNPANEAALTRLAQEQLLPAYRSLPGFQSMMNGADRTTGRLLSITTWDTEQHAQAVAEAAPIRELLSPFQAAGVEFDQPPVVYEIIGQS